MLRSRSDRARLPWLALALCALCSAVACEKPTPPAPAAVAHPPQPRRARLASLSGEARVKRADSEEWIGAFEKMELSKDDKVRTLKGAKATLVFDEGSSLTLGEESLIVIQELPVDSSGRSGVMLLRGRLDAEVDRSRNDLTVRTPAAAARAGREIVFQ